MRILNCNSADAIETEPHAQPIDKVGKIFITFFSKSVLLRIKPLADVNGQTNHVQAKARIIFLSQRRKTVGKQAPYPHGIAQRSGRSNIKPYHLAIGTEQDELDAPRPFPPLLKHVLQFMR